MIELCPQFLTHDLQTSNYDKDYNLLEVPSFRNAPKKIKEDDDWEAKIDMIKVSITRIEASLAPAHPLHIKECLGRLALHKGIGSYNEGQSIALINDYMRLLSNYPYDLLYQACDECILDPHMPFFPQVGRLTDKMKKGVSIRCLYLERLRKILELSKNREQRPDEPKRNPNPVEFGLELAARFKP